MFVFNHSKFALNCDKKYQSTVFYLFIYYYLIMQITCNCQYSTYNSVLAIFSVIIPPPSLSKNNTSCSKCMLNQYKKYYQNIM